MPINESFNADSVERYNLGGVTLHVHTFTTGVNPTGPRGFYSSSLQGVVGYWFNRTSAPTTASLVANEVSLISGSDGQFRFITNELPCPGKLYTLSLT